MADHLYKQLSAAYDLGFELGKYDVEHRQASDILSSANATPSLKRTRLAFFDYGQGYADAVGGHWDPDVRRKELARLQTYADRLPQKESMTAKTLWTDAMILESVRDHHGMSPAAEARAYTLSRDGYIDMHGTWKLTPKGEAYLASVRRQNPLPISKPILIALGIGGAALVGVVAWRIYGKPTALPAPPAPTPTPSEPPTPLTPVEPPTSGMWAPAQSMTTGNAYLVVFAIPDGKSKPSSQEIAASAGSHMAMPTLIYWPNSGMPWPVELTSAPASIDQTKVAVMTFQWTGAPQTAQQLAAGDAQYVMEWQGPVPLA